MHPGGGHTHCYVHNFCSVLKYTTHRILSLRWQRHVCALVSVSKCKWLCVSGMAGLVEELMPSLRLQEKLAGWSTSSFSFRSWNRKFLNLLVIWNLWLGSHRCYFLQFTLERLRRCTEEISEAGHFSLDWSRIFQIFIFYHWNLYLQHGCN